MQRAEVSVEVCHVEEQDRSSEKKQKTIKNKRPKRSHTRATRKKQKPVESDWETPVSEWEDEDELDASQYLQGGDPDLRLVRKRPAKETSPGIELGNGPAVKRQRTSGHEMD